MAVERAPSQRVLQHPEDFEQPDPRSAVCAYGGHDLSAAVGYMFFRGTWYCFPHFARNGPLCYSGAKFSAER